MTHQPLSHQGLVLQVACDQERFMEAVNGLHRLAGEHRQLSEPHKRIGVVADVPRQREAVLVQPGGSLIVAQAGRDETQVLEWLRLTPSVPKLTKQLDAVVPGGTRRLETRLLSLGVTEEVQRIGEAPAICGCLQQFNSFAAIRYAVGDTASGNRQPA